MSKFYPDVESKVDIIDDYIDTEVAAIKAKTDLLPATFQLQADATLAEAPPTGGLKYEVLATATNVRIVSIEVDVTWTVQPTPLEIHLTIDGVALVHTVANPVSTTKYVAYLRPDVVAASQELLPRAQANDLTAPPFIYEGRSVKVEAETTGGTVQNLNAIVKYLRKV